MPCCMSCVKKLWNWEPSRETKLLFRIRSPIFNRNSIVLRVRSSAVTRNAARNCSKVCKSLTPWSQSLTNCVSWTASKRNTRFNCYSRWLQHVLISTTSKSSRNEWPMTCSSKRLEMPRFRENLTILFKIAAKLSRLICDRMKRSTTWGSVDRPKKTQMKLRSTRFRASRLR